MNDTCNLCKKNVEPFEGVSIVVHGECRTHINDLELQLVDAQKQTCPECEGEGWLPIEPRPMPPQFPITKTCLLCSGTGSVTAVELFEKLNSDAFTATVERAEQAEAMNQEFVEAFSRWGIRLEWKENPNILVNTLGDQREKAEAANVKLREENERLRDEKQQRHQDILDEGMEEGPQ